MFKNSKRGLFFLPFFAFLASIMFSGCAETSEQITTSTPISSPQVFSSSVSPTPTAEPDKEPLGELYEVVNVVDGDTIDVILNGKKERLRLIGMDTPETVDPRKPVQCFGKEASNKAKETLSGKKVFLEADTGTQGERDKYQRLLRFVYLEDGTFFNKMMIAEGYAHEYTYNSIPYKYQTEFKEAEKQARENKKGLWGDLCGGDTTQGAEPTPAPTSKATPTITPTLTSTSKWVCDCSKTCPNMSCEEAQCQLNSCGCTARDRDGDGVACDSQCQ